MKQAKGWPGDGGDESLLKKDDQVRWIVSKIFVRHDFSTISVWRLQKLNEDGMWNLGIYMKIRKNNRCQILFVLFILLPHNLIMSIIRKKPLFIKQGLNIGKSLTIYTHTSL